MNRFVLKNIFKKIYRCFEDCVIIQNDFLRKLEGVRRNGEISRRTRSSLKSTNPFSSELSRLQAEKTDEASLTLILVTLSHWQLGRVRQFA